MTVDFKPIGGSILKVALKGEDSRFLLTVELY
jgi:hypothetical protein